MPPEDEIATLKAENATLRAQVQALLERVRELEGRRFARLASCLYAPPAPQLCLT